MLNKYLQEQMEGLTAKVFRTYNASITLQEQLEELTAGKSHVKLCHNDVVDNSRGRRCAFEDPVV